MDFPTTATTATQSNFGVVVGGVDGLPDDRDDRDA